jgi:hypothetical protein
MIMFFTNFARVSDDGFTLWTLCGCLLLKEEVGGNSSVFLTVYSTV